MTAWAAILVFALVAWRFLVWACALAAPDPTSRARKGARWTPPRYTAPVKRGLFWDDRSPVVAHRPEYQRNGERAGVEGTSKPAKPQS